MSGTDLARDLASAVSSMEPEPTVRLAGIYHRNIARRLWQLAPADWALPGGPEGWRRVARLHPRLIWATATLRRGGALPAAVIERLPQDLADAQSSPTDRCEIAYTAETRSEPWAQAVLADASWQPESDQPSGPAGSAAARLDKTGKTAPGPAAEALFTQATATISRIWPEAASEIAAVVRVIVHTNVAGLRSATVENCLGAILVGASADQDLTALVELLLHETGHHALFVRAAFDPLVDNGSATANHPLRPDPRPVDGVLHAAFVLARMATGMDHWHEIDPNDDVRHRRDTSTQRLGQVLTTLEGCAEWRPAGRALFEQLVEHHDRLQRSMGVT